MNQTTTASYDMSAVTKTIHDRLVALGMLKQDITIRKDVENCNGLAGIDLALRRDQDTI
ncbi:MAG TPA: hypothetical protein VHL31_23460 [Geminicoccus sp.]|jgi:hypothetical protein|uniref:hypothetical protein n=1 Tax=Geminicoccus sp. TaxID=2024832 RepID=UPI002E31FC42|nr:hypothetical protein [Geminicoccus sp.]HEX2529243.1 hypothetical protein [Geminicoccus sp.]